MLYLSFPSVLEVFSLPSEGIQDVPPNVMPDVRIPEREERRLLRQCNLHKREVFIADSSQGSRRVSNASGTGSESAEPKLLPNL